MSEGVVMSKHTAGPWAIVDGHYPCMKEVIGPSFKINIVMSATDLDFNDFLKRSADAQLIAAAPDLLEALQDALLWVDGSTKVKVRAAIAKATGGQL